MFGLIAWCAVCVDCLVWLWLSIDCLDCGFWFLGLMCVLLV